MAKKSKRKPVRNQRLLKGLRSVVHRERNGAALELRELVQDAIVAIWRSIRRPANRNNRGTLVYTLELLDCSEHFDDLIDLAINGNLEVQCHALRILQRQSFLVTKSQLRKAWRSVRAMKPRENLPAKDLRWLRTELEFALKRLE